MLTVSDIAPGVVWLIAFVFGALWGSFFNVAIHRWPRGLSVVSPPSHCPACHARIPAYLNVPIFGYLWLRGRAACCGAPLSPRYPLIELLSAVLCLALAQRGIVNAPAGTLLLPAALWTLCDFAFVGGLIVATFVDLEHMEIPDEVSLPGAALGLAVAAFRPEPDAAAAAALGAGGGFLVIQLLFVWAYERLTGRRGMGEGDAKLLLMIGAFTGWQGALFALFAGAAQGIVAALVLLASGRSLSPVPSEAEPMGHEAHRDHDPRVDSPADRPEPALPGEVGPSDEPPPAHLGHLKMPFGPFLALGALEYLFFGDALVSLYFTWLVG